MFHAVSRSDLWRDQPEVVVAALVHHRNAIVVEVAEDDELVLRAVERFGGIFDRHRQDRKIVRLDDARLPFRSGLAQTARLQHLHGPLRHRADRGLVPAAVLAVMIADRAAVLLRLTFYVI